MSVKRPGYEHAHYPHVISTQQWRENVIENRHQKAEHGAFACTLYHVQETYVWPGMYDDIRKILAKCWACKMSHTNKSHVHLGQMPMPHYPHLIVSMDLVGPFPRSKFGLFTLIDHLTGWADFYLIAHKRGETIAEILNKQYFPKYGFPEVIISDNGPDFCNADVTALFGSLGIEHHRTNVYHPQSNCQIERFHWTIKSMLRKLIFRKNASWKTRLETALVAYRNTVHSSTRFTPFQAFYGRVNRLPCQNSNDGHDTTSTDSLRHLEDYPATPKRQSYKQWTDNCETKTGRGLTSWWPCARTAVNIYTKVV